MKIYAVKSGFYSDVNALFSTEEYAKTYMNNRGGEGCNDQRIEEYELDSTVGESMKLYSQAIIAIQSGEITWTKSEQELGLDNENATIQGPAKQEGRFKPCQQIYVKTQGDKELAIKIAVEARKSYLRRKPQGEDA